MSRLTRRQHLIRPFDPSTVRRFGQLTVPKQVEPTTLLRLDLERGREVEGSRDRLSTSILSKPVLEGRYRRRIDVLGG